MRTEVLDVVTQLAIRYIINYVVYIPSSKQIRILYTSFFDYYSACSNSFDISILLYVN